MLLRCLFDNQQMVELFKKDLVKKGHSNPDIKPVPNGEVAFIFCKIKGNSRL